MVDIKPAKKFKKDEKYGTENENCTQISIQLLKFEMKFQDKNEKKINSFNISRN